MSGFAPLLLFFSAAYLAGSVNFSILAARLSGKGDIRKLGSGNPGTANTYRILGREWAILILLLDAGRGAAGMVLARTFLPGSFEPLLGSLGVPLGNLFPVFHGFRGGKGVATTIGLFCALDLWVGGVGLLVWLALATVTRRSSIASLGMVACYPPVLWLREADPYVLAFSGLLIPVIAWTHRRNIRRLVRGEEARIERIRIP